MAKAKKKKPPMPVGNRVPNPSNASLGGRVKQAVLAGVMARYAYPAIAHVASLPGRLGIGFDDTESPSAPSKKALVLAKVQPPPKNTPQPPPPPTPPAAPPTTGKRIKSVVINPAVAKALKYGAVGQFLGGPLAAVPSAMVGAFKGSKMDASEKRRRNAYAAATGKDEQKAALDIPDYTVMEHAGNLLGDAASSLGRGFIKAATIMPNEDMVRRARKFINGAVPAGGKAIANLGRSVLNTPVVKKFGEGLREDINDIKGGISRGVRSVRDKLGFDNEEFLSPSSCRATKKLSPGRALMTSLRAANEPSQTRDRKALHEVAFEAVKLGDFTTARRIANLEQRLDEQARATDPSLMDDQPQVAEQSPGQVALPSQGRIPHGTRRNRAAEGQLRASMDQLNPLAQGQVPQNPIGMDADEHAALVPSPQRKSILPLSAGQAILKKFRDQNALGKRLERAAKFDGETMEGVGMDNATVCVTCGICPCCCTRPSSKRVSSPGRKVMEELRKQRIEKQKVEKAMNPLPGGFSN